MTAFFLDRFSLIICQGLAFFFSSGDNNIKKYDAIPEMYGGYYAKKNIFLFKFVDFHCIPGARSGGEFW